ncbi:MAG TPA: hypothetical protein VGI63_03840 [Verrucomicrobiae bacterium]|jgi:hypothetical protein
MKKFVKFSAIVFLFFVLAFGVCLSFFEASPPKEAGLIQKFNENHDTYEQLREMLQTDPYLSRREEYSPPEKIEKYQSLLKVVGSPSVWVDGRGTNADLFFMVWGRGFAGETEHLCICWLNQIPTNQITTLDGYRGQSRYPDTVVVYKHIEQQWYLSADW